jgi:hypothetical protein
MTDYVDIDGIEDAIIEAISGLKSEDKAMCRKVISAGRNEVPNKFNYPTALVYFVNSADQGIRSRPVSLVTFEIILVNKNLASLQAAKDSTYAVIKAVRDAIHGRDLDIKNIEQFVCTSIAFSGYDAGEISYVLQFQCKHYLPTVSPTLGA